MRKLIEKIDILINSGNRGKISSILYDVIMLTAIVASMIPLVFHETCKAFEVIEIVTVSIFIFDYLARWFTSKKQLNKGKLSFVIYPFTPMAIIDLLSIIPAIGLIDSTFKLFRLTRLLKVSRILKSFRYSKRIQMLGRVLYKERKVLLSVLIIAILYIVVTALVMFNIEPQINPITREKTFTTFFDAIYWATVTLTTVGYGDICPVTSIGRMVSIISSLLGIAIIALPSGVITASYLDEIKRNRTETED